MDIQLEQGEYILLEENDTSYFYSDEEEYCDRLILTNKNIIRCEEKTRLFKKTELIVEKMPLNKILILDGKPEVFSKKEDFSHVLHINFGDRIVLFDLGNEKSAEWADRIISLIQK